MGLLIRRWPCEIQKEKTSVLGLNLKPIIMLEVMVLLLNIIIGFIIPWIFGIILFFINKKVLFNIYPIASMLAYTVTSLEIDIHLWILEPTKYYLLPAIPFCLGLFPISTCYLIHFIDRTKIRPYKLIILFTIMTTIAEGLGVFIGKIHYKNGWNIIFTFLSYLIPYIISCIYYSKGKKILR